MDNQQPTPESNCPPPSSLVGLLSLLVELIPLVFQNGDLVFLCRGALFLSIRILCLLGFLCLGPLRRDGFVVGQWRLLGLGGALRHDYVLLVGRARSIGCL